MEVGWEGMMPYQAVSSRTYQGQAVRSSLQDHDTIFFSLPFFFMSVRGIEPEPLQLAHKSRKESISDFPQISQAGL